MIARVLPVLALLAAAMGAAPPWFAWYADREKGVDVRYVAPLDEREIGIRRGLYQPGQDPAILHGDPIGSGSTRILVYDEAKLLRVKDGPAAGQSYYVVEGGEYPIQTQTVFFGARNATGGLLLGGGMLMLLARFLAGRR